MGELISFDEHRRRAAERARRNAKLTDLACGKTLQGSVGEELFEHARTSRDAWAYLANGVWELVPSVAERASHVAQGHEVRFVRVEVPNA